MYQGIKSNTSEKTRHALLIKAQLLRLLMWNVSHSS